MKSLVNVHGNWVDGDRFWDREKEMELFLEKIQEGNHIHLLAQRRIGKTSLMKEAARRLKDDFFCLFIDIQDAMDPADVVAALGIATRPYSFWESTKRLFRNLQTMGTNIFEKVGYEGVFLQLRAGMTAGDWKEKGDQLFSILAKVEKPVVLFIDEIPIFVHRLLKGQDYQMTPERKAQTDEFMTWLRKNSQQHQGRVRIVLSGSIGFEPILRQAGLSASINNFQSFSLEPWPDSTAIACIHALALNRRLALLEGVPERMVEKLGCCIPHHVQMFFDFLYSDCRLRSQETCSVEDVDRVYQQSMLSTKGHVELTHYEERLKRVLGEELLPLTLDLVTEAAVMGSLTPSAIQALLASQNFPVLSSADALKEILAILEHDGYLKKKGADYVFVSNLLKDWWNARHKAFFTPAAQRRV